MGALVGNLEFISSGGHESDPRIGAKGANAGAIIGVNVGHGKSSRCRKWLSGSASVIIAKSGITVLFTFFGGRHQV